MNEGFITPINDRFISILSLRFFIKETERVQKIRRKCSCGFHLNPLQLFILSHNIHFVVVTIAEKPKILGKAMIESLLEQFKYNQVLEQETFS